MWWWCNYMTTKQFFLSHQWLVFSQLLRAFSFCLSYFSALFNTSDYYVLLETLFVTWNVHKHCCFPSVLSTLSFSFFSSPSLKLTCTFVHSHRFKYHFWFVSSQICRENASHLSVFTCWPLSKEYVSLLILIYQVSVWICLFQRILTLSGLDHIFPF